MQKGGFLVRAELKISSALTELVQLRKFVREVCHGIALGEDDSMQIELAVNEAACNIMGHAYKGDPNQQIWVEVEAGEEYISVQLCHWGEAFDPANVDLPAFDGSREHGFGLYIINQCVDEVIYLSGEKSRNCTRLIKKRKKS